MLAERVSMRPEKFQLRPNLKNRRFHNEALLAVVDIFRGGAEMKAPIPQAELGLSEILGIARWNP